MKTKDYFENFAFNLDANAWNAETAPWAKWSWKIVERSIGRAEGKVIVDLGTGTGAGIEKMAAFTRNARFIGVDFAENMIRKAMEKDYNGAASVDFLLSRIDTLKLPLHSVFAFVSSGTFHHIKNKRRVLTNLAQMLAPGGIFINIDHFRPSSRYKGEMESLQVCHPRLAKETKRIRGLFQWLYDQDRHHPIEFHTDPYQFVDIGMAAGFSTGRVDVSLLPSFSVVSLRVGGHKKMGGGS